MNEWTFCHLQKTKAWRVQVLSILIRNPAQLPNRCVFHIQAEERPAWSKLFIALCRKPALTEAELFWQRETISQFHIKSIEWYIIHYLILLSYTGIHYIRGCVVCIKRVLSLFYNLVWKCLSCTALIVTWSWKWSGTAHIHCIIFTEGISQFSSTQ